MTKAMGVRLAAAALALCAWMLPACAAGQSSPATPGPQGASAAPGGVACPQLLNLTHPRLQDDAPQNLCQYAGKVLLVVNTASYCGFTPQYQGLERLYDTYRSRGFVVLGFPSNDFGQQEPGSNRQIAEFCENTFLVKFPMFAKTRVSGADVNPLFAALARASGSAPRWNFHKYLIARDGRVVAGYPSAVDPLDKRLVQEVEKLL